MAGLTFGSNLFGSEQSVLPSPLASQTLKNFSTTSNNATVYTVPSGKKFFIGSCYIGTNVAPSGVLFWWVAGGDIIVKSEGTSLPAERSFAVPIQLDEAETIATARNAGTGEDAVWTLEGWEESA